MCPSVYKGGGLSTLDGGIYPPSIAHPDDFCPFLLAKDVTYIPLGGLIVINSIVAAWGSSYILGIVAAPTPANKTSGSVGSKRVDRPRVPGQDRCYRLPAQLLRRH